MTDICVGLGWDTRCDIDSSILLFDADRNAVDNIYYGHKRSANGSVVHEGDNLTGDGAGDDEVINVYLK